MSFTQEASERHDKMDSVPPAATLRILVRDFESDAFNRNGADFISPRRLQFSDFSVEYIAQGNIRRFEYARQFFDEAMYGDCLIERAYNKIPPLAGDYSGFGRIILVPEELLLLLRLFRPGDLVFVAVKIEKLTHAEPRHFSLRPYRIISGIGGDSTRQFVLYKKEVKEWERFAAVLSSSPSWNATWFNVARRCFLHGSSDEFNPNFPNEIDRVADYIAALEAALVHETDFVSRRLRERAVKLLALEDKESTVLGKLLSELYGIRSTLVHGSPLSPDQMAFLQDRERWWKFEDEVRKILVEAVKKVPPDEVRRKHYLASLFDIDDEARAAQIGDQFRRIKDRSVKQNVLGRLHDFL